MVDKSKKLEPYGRIIKLSSSSLDRNLERPSRIHFIQSCTKVLEFENVCDHSIDVNLSAVQVLDSPREAVGLGE